jgi:division protein CdvB (Snf7/Vps24/ESCRT-III family)
MPKSSIAKKHPDNRVKKNVTWSLKKIYEEINRDLTEMENMLEMQLQTLQHDVTPATQGVAPEAQGVAPEAQGVAPEAQGVEPEE